jgi:hypothetical protein
VIRIDPEGYKHTGRTRDDLEVVLLESAALLQVGTVWILLDHIEPGFPELLAACLTKPIPVVAVPPVIEVAAA